LGCVLLGQSALGTAQALNYVCTHCTCGHGHADAREEGQVVAGVDPVPHGRQQEGSSCGVNGTALIAHPEENGHGTRLALSQNSCKQIK